MKRKTLNYAVRNLTSKQRQLIRRAFAATGVLDVYDGDLTHYLAVIAQRIEGLVEENSHLRRSVRDIRSITDLTKYKEKVDLQRVKPGPFRKIRTEG
jgi:hypothetical protein